MRNTKRPTEEQEDEIAFTDEQIKAINSLSRLMKKCEKLGVHFFKLKRKAVEELYPVTIKIVNKV